ncbi:hypothetical protein SYNTR_1739 [Candidatus Syntrophocurvum alkaliphilum]|uniref:Uncharacterized protein n=1 Tax=Candidatus Syntrophocurvum alkaliphilum TaxID=2293317 RepID=A0A6I6DCD9_9FIRM|nr:hypothetical protein [Candidatus Syntrophocurvum alkaliphilum]QGU00333.1 hypothetical protein SYNTR_1739 [Candidatus Syntrophocurvum alkaliphilum]
MKNDERINIELNKANSIGYTVFWFGIFAVLLYRWFFLNQTLMETLDIFLVWFIASVFQFLTLATKGIPISYPFSMRKNEHLYFIFFPIFTGLLSVGLLFFFRNVVEFKVLLGGFAVTFFGTIVILFIYKTIVYFWEKIYTE